MTNGRLSMVSDTTVPGVKGEAGTLGNGFEDRGTENALPISDSVSERTCMRREGAMAGIW